MFRPPVPEFKENPVAQNGPAGEDTKKSTAKVKHPKTHPIRRVHITTDLTVEALQAIEAIRQDYRLKHGKVLPQWKVLSQAIAFYAQARGIGKPA